MSPSAGSGVRVEDCAKRIRVYFGGEMVVDTVAAKYVWENRPYPAYYLPLADVRNGVLVPSTTTSHSDARGDARHFNVSAGGKEAVDGAWQYANSPVEQLRDLVRFQWDAMDAWFEEDEEVFTHARSPYSRIDILPTSRRVVVSIDGVALADSTHAHVLYETGLPARWYLPKVDVRMDLLEPTDSVSHCPYKGQAAYWSARINDRVEADIAWSYKTPLPESERVAGLVCFYNERVNLTVDGVPQQRPQTPWSSRS
jgi:uncharacterized protein (DUF427 family)